MPIGPAGRHSPLDVYDIVNHNDPSPTAATNESPRSDNLRNDFSPPSTSSWTSTPSSLMRSIDRDDFMMDFSLDETNDFPPDDDTADFRLPPRRWGGHHSILDSEERSERSPLRDGTVSLMSVANTESMSPFDSSFLDDDGSQQAQTRLSPGTSDGTDRCVDFRYPPNQDEDAPIIRPDYAGLRRHDAAASEAELAARIWNLDLETPENSPIPGNMFQSDSDSE